MKHLHRDADIRGEWTHRNKQTHASDLIQSTIGELTR